MTKLYLVTIETGYIGLEKNYIASEYDNLYAICCSDQIIDDFKGYVGAFPSTEEIILEQLYEGVSVNIEEAEDILEEIISDALNYDKKLATVEDINTFGILPESVLYEECEEIQIYKTILLRDINIDKIINN